MTGKNNNYYDLFIEMGNVLEDSIRMTHKILNDFKIKNLPKQMEEIHKIESRGDEITHQIMDKLTKDFITPLEREDIIGIAYGIDDIIDVVEKVIQQIYMYDIKEITSETIKLLKIIEKCGKELLNVLKEFANFKKSKTIRNSIIEINHLEEQADKIYIEAMHDLYHKNNLAINILSWTQIYNCLEKCCDMFEVVADSIDSIIMKNI